MRNCAASGCLGYRVPDACDGEDGEGLRLRLRLDFRLSSDDTLGYQPCVAFPPSALRIGVVVSFPFIASFRTSGGPSGVNLTPPFARMFLAALTSLSMEMPHLGQWRVRRPFGCSVVLDPHIEQFTLVPLAAT